MLLPGHAYVLEALVKRQETAMPPPPTPEEIEFSNAPQILSITGSFFAIAAVVVLLRCYVRLGMLKVFGVDDYAMAFAMLLATVCFACFKAECDNGLGKHFMVMLITNPAGYVQFSKILYVHSILVMVGLSAVKISIAFFLLRLSTNKLFHRFLYVVMVFIVLLTIACSLTLIFQCLPVEAAWDMALRPPPFGTGTAKCYDMTTFRNLGLMNSSFNIVTDILFAMIPIPLIWKLQMNKRTKFSLIAILSLGWFACAAGIIKAVQQFHVLEDPDWTVNDSFNIWNYIELTVGITAASLPSLKPLFITVLESARAMTTGYGKSKGTGYSPGSRYKDAGSLGYFKQQDVSTQSIVMDDISGKESLAPNPYKVRISTQPLDSREEAWDHSNEKDQTMRHQEGGHPGGIAVTREVHVS